MLKKFLYGFAVAALAASCSEDFDDWASPQGNPDNAEIQNVHFAATPAADIDIATAGDVIPFFTYELSMSEGYQFDSIAVDVVDGDSKHALDIIAEGTSVSVDKTELTAIVEGMYGKRPVARPIQFLVTAYAFTSSAQTTLVRALSDTLSLNVTPEAPVIEDAYYYVGGATSWSDTDKTYLLTNGGGDPYENPVFRVTVPAIGGDHWFKIAPASAYTRDEGFWGGDMVGAAVNAMSDMEGKLVVGKNDEVALSWKIDEVANPGLFYTIEVNMLDQTYKITALNFGSWLYEIGSESGWSANHALYGPANDGKYQGYYYLDGEFKFKPNEGDWAGDYEYTGDASNVLSGTIADVGGSNCPDPGAGFYQIDVDLAAGTYSLFAISQMSLIGSAVNGDQNWGTDYDLEFNVATMAWEGTYTMTDGEYKIRANHDWSLSWGGATDAMTSQNGANLSISAGTYKFSFKPNADGLGVLTVEAL